MAKSRGWTLGVLVGLVALCATPALAAVQINIGSAAVGTDGKATIPVTLASGGEAVGGMQNDILFDNTQLTLSAGDCRINADIGTVPDGCNQDPVVGPCKTLSKTLKQCGTTPQPAGCPAGAPTTMSVFRGIVAATAVPNTNAIPDGVLYTCVFSMATGATLPATLTNSNIVASSPTGTRLTDVSGSNGSVTGGGGGPTNTPGGPTNTPGAATNTPTQGGGGTPTPTPTGVQINLANAVNVVAGKAPVPVTLISDGEMVGGMQNDILFDNTMVTLTAADCVINPAIGTAPDGCNQDPVVGPCKTLSKTLKQCGTTPQPAGCPAGAPTTTSVFRGIVAATAVPNTNPIPDGTLYTCTFTVVGPTPITLTNSNIVASSPTGTRLTDVSGSNGSIGGGVVPTTPSGPTNTPSGPTNTPSGPTNTPGGPTATPTGPTRTPGGPTNTPGGATRTATATGTVVVTPGRTTLATAITATQTTIPVTNLSGFPNSGTVLIDSEAITYNGTTTLLGGPGGTLNNAGRGANGTTPAAHAAGATVTLLTPSQQFLDDDGCNFRVASSDGSRGSSLLLLGLAALLVLRRRRR